MRSRTGSMGQRREDVGERSPFKLLQELCEVWERARDDFECARGLRLAQRGPPTHPALTRTRELDGQLA
ncbi:MAG: hypothetical protein HYV07_06955 [Deltaproteobacteria bacterium]|nr:hypothetical protein [Deltaproteobacteria bacterium]